MSLQKGANTGGVKIVLAVNPSIDRDPKHEALRVAQHESNVAIVEVDLSHDVRIQRNDPAGIPVAVHIETVTHDLEAPVEVEDAYARRVPLVNPQDLGSLNR